MGNHRAPRSRTAPPRWLTAMAALTAVFVMVVVAIKLGAGTDADSTAGSRTPSPGANATTGSPTSSSAGSGTPSASATPTSTASGSPSSSPRPSPTRTTAPRDLRRLVPSTARQLLVGDLIDAGFDLAVAPVDGRLTSASVDEVSRWGARGLPGNPAEDTVVIVGSTAPGGALARLDSVRRGDRISLRTDNGLVTYTVDSVDTVGSAGAASAPAVRARVPGRLVVLGARFDDGARAARDLLVVASISAVRPG